jgi:hypothetical protein
VIPPFRLQTEVAKLRIDVKTKGMKTLPETEINNRPQLDAQCETFRSCLEERIYEALVERAEPSTFAQFEENMRAIAEGR